jgi:pyruvate/2-oxoglutarate dehydrogenase complex dihydrolipoamide dehydrogenase (E3) component
MAQAFSVFGSAVSIVASDFLPREDEDAKQVLLSALTADGVKLEIGGKINRVNHDGKVFSLHVLRSDGTALLLEGEQLLVAAGRKPNVAGLGLEAANVRFDLRKVFLSIVNNLKTEGY